MTWKNSLKYFLHGLTFSLVFLVLDIFWMLIVELFWTVAFLITSTTGLLLIFSSFIGLIVGFVVLFLIIGGLNSFLTELIWHFSTRTNWTSLLTHGVVLSAVLIIASSPAILINLSSPSLTTAPFVFIVYAFIDGFIARKVAEFWGEESL